MKHSPRYLKLTSSRIAGLYNCGYGTELKTQLEILNPVDEFIESAAIDRGNELEQTVANWCGKKIGIEWIRAPRRGHPDHPHFSDSVDYCGVFDDGRAVICEAKTASGRVAKEWGVQGTDEIPKHYLLQCYWHLIHWPEAVRCYVPVLIGGDEFEYRLYIVERDEEILRFMLTHALAWYERHITRGERCVATAGDDDTLKKLYPSRTDRDKDLIENNDPLIARLAKQYKALDAEIKKLTDEKDGIKNHLCQIVGDARGIVGEWGKCTWGDRKGQISWGKLVEENFSHLVTDEMREKYQSNYRVFAIKENKND